MEKNYVASPFKTFYRLLRVVFISILSGALTGALAAVIGSLFKLER